MSSERRIELTVSAARLAWRVHDELLVGVKDLLEEALGMGERDLHVASAVENQDGARDSLRHSLKIEVLHGGGEFL